VKNAAPTYSLRSRYEIESKKKVPGPGAYEPISPPRKRAASHVFGSASQREAIKNQRSPGPGNYSIPCSIGNLPGYTNARPKMSVI